MPSPLWVLMAVLPLAEITLLIQSGQALGLWPTLGAVALAALTGSLLLRHQGLATLARLRVRMEAGLLPGPELFDGACLLLAAGLLMAPGFLTDSAGLLLLLPPVRALLRRPVLAWIGRQLAARQRDNRAAFGVVIDSDFTKTYDGAPTPPVPSGLPPGAGRDSQSPSAADRS